MFDILGQLVQPVGLQNTCQPQGGVSEMMTASFAFVNKFTFHVNLGALKLLFYSDWNIYCIGWQTDTQIMWRLVVSAFCFACHRSVYFIQ